MQRPLTCVEICAGAGGQALGLAMAGFVHVALVEYERDYCKVLKDNRPEWNVICADVHSFDGRPYKGVDLLAGGVPCPPFSVAGKQLGKDDERDLFPEAIRLIREIRPRAVMLENVRGFLDSGFEEYRDHIFTEIKKLGYVTHIKLLNASDYGVPQLRPRVVIVGIRKDQAGAFEYPQEHPGESPTVGETLCDLMSQNGWKGAKKWAEGADRIAPTLVGGSKKHGGPDLGPTRAKNAWAELGVDGKGIANEAPEPDFDGMPRLTSRMMARIPKDEVLIAMERKRYHERLLQTGTLAINANGVATNADKDSVISVMIAKGIAEQLMAETNERVAGQTAGASFEMLTMEFVKRTFPQLQHLRPGNWEVLKLGNRSRTKTSTFAQYEHLAYLTELTKANRKLSAMIGNDYMVAPDIVVYRNLCSDEEINATEPIVNDTVCRYADLREKNGGKAILHASVSAKWTMRSDRAQNSRTEALNLIRNRKGHLPHIVVLTGEPLPSRIASLALGTGDIDCVYHFALPELIASVNSTERADVIETLKTLVEGKRLKDISDLPLDLSV